MYKSLKTISICLIGLMSVAIVSCNENEENQQKEESVKKGMASYNQMKYEKTLAQLCEIDSTSTPGSIIYIPRLGEAIDPIQPNVFYVGVESEGEARSLFKSHFYYQDSEDNFIENGQISLDYGEYGSVRYSANNGRSEWGSIDIDFPELKDVISKIVFIPSAKWPENSYSSPFYPGDIVRGPEGWLWLCVRACEGGISGILMTWDGGVDAYYHEDHYKSFYEVKGCSGWDAWDALAQFYYNNVEEFQSMYETIEPKFPGSRLIQGAFDNLYYHKWEEETFQVGDTWVHEYFWLLGTWRWIWQGQTDWVKLKSDPVWIDGMPRFQRGYDAFDEKQSGVTPNDRQNHATYFRVNDTMPGWTKLYP